MVMLEATTKIKKRITKAKGHEYSQIRIDIPRDLARDSAFPFIAGDEIKIRIQGKQLTIEKV